MEKAAYVKRRFVPSLAAALFVLGFLAWAGPARAASEASLYQYAEQARQQFEQDTKAKDFRHGWLNVIDRYDRVIKKNPAGRWAAPSLMHIGDLNAALFRRSGQDSVLDDALDAYRRLTKRFPQDPLAPSAQLKIGQLYLDLKKDRERAFAELLKVTLDYPESDQALEARAWLAKISGRPAAGPPAPSGKGTAAAGPQTPSGKGTAAAGSPPPEAQPAKVLGVRQWSTPSYTRVVVDLDGPAAFQDHLLRPDPETKAPRRIYLDLSNARIQPQAQNVLDIANRLLQRVRVGQYDASTVRLVLDIESIESYRIFALADPYRIVVDVTGAQAAVGPQASTKTQPGGEPLTTDLKGAMKKRKKVPRGQAQDYSDQPSLARQLGLGVKRVVIDPGHGGKDPGTLGVTGLVEKDLTLKVARLLAEKIQEKTGIECLLTRTDDRYLPLEERTAIANTAGADLFISIHANAHNQRSVRGLEIYFLNLATDAEAMRVAALENAATTKSMSDLQVILGDLMLNSKITESCRLAQVVQKETVGALSKQYKAIKDMGVKQAPFYVLLGANMPSVLIEMGYISNEAEESRMRDEKYLGRLADGIVAGVRGYCDAVKTAVADQGSGSRPGRNP
jgi:N-acetylmuramoyl-L-alanine amidase